MIVRPSQYLNLVQASKAGLDLALETARALIQVRRQVKELSDRLDRFAVNTEERVQELEAENRVANLIHRGARPDPSTRPELHLAPEVAESEGHNPDPAA